MCNRSLITLHLQFKLCNNVCFDDTGKSLEKERNIAGYDEVPAHVLGTISSYGVNIRSRRNCFRCARWNRNGPGPSHQGSNLYAIYKFKKINFSFICFLYSKVAQVAAHTLGIDLSMISVKPSNNMITPNNSVTGGSITSESCAFVNTAYPSGRKFPILGNEHFRSLCFVFKL